MIKARRPRGFEVLEAVSRHGAHARSFSGSSIFFVVPRLASQLACVRYSSERFQSRIALAFITTIGEFTNLGRRDIK